VDFNTEFQLPQVPFTVAVCAGSLEYINDLAGFFLPFSEHAPGKQVIFIYLPDPAKADRKEMKTHNHFTDLPELLAKIAFSHLDILATRKHTVFIIGTLSNGAEASSVNRKSLNELLLPPPPATSRIDRFLLRVSRSVAKRIRRISTSIFEAAIKNASIWPCVKPSAAKPAFELIEQSFSEKLEFELSDGHAVGYAFRTTAIFRLLPERTPGGYRR
jgi:hypothetical protein